EHARYLETRCSEGRAPLWAPALDSSLMCTRCGLDMCCRYRMYTSSARQTLLGRGDVHRHGQRTALDLVRDLLHLCQDIGGKGDIARSKANTVVLHGELQWTAHIQVVNNALDRVKGGDVHPLQSASDH